MKRHRRPARQRAVALAYDADRDAAPRVTARGEGFVAARIVEEAKRHGVAVHRDPALAELLSQLDVNAQIPPPLYRAMAEVLAFVYALSEEGDGSQRGVNREATL